MKAVDEALDFLFPVGGAPSNLAPWQKALLVLEKFNVPVLGEQNALSALCEIINYVNFPNSQMAKSFTKRAVSFIPKILCLDPDHELGVDEVAFIQMCLDRGESIAEIKAHWQHDRSC